jgi:hypothetical protein
MKWFATISALTASRASPPQAMGLLSGYFQFP